MGIEFNNKRLEKTSKFINYSIAIVLCGFLIALSNRLIGDMDDYSTRPQLAQYKDLELVAKQNEELKVIGDSLKVNQERREQIKNKVSIAKSNYINAKESFENWLKARKTIGSANEDKAVLDRANKLDIYYATQQSCIAELDKASKVSVVYYDQRRACQGILDEDKEKARGKLGDAMHAYDLKVFLKRLLFVLPVLLLGIYFVMKFRKHKYWPLFLGFVMFSLYAFFFGLVPFLPSYGGYVRSIVGIILCVLMGIYAINKIKVFIERKKKELKEPTTDRAKNVLLETAEKALENHMCPSCGKDFIVKEWAAARPQENKSRSYVGITTDFCRFCGLELFKKCSNCETKNFAHLPYCASCGTKVTDCE